MGLGPSIKMTTLHHYHCPITKCLSEDEDLDFPGIIVNGVSEVFDDKVFTAIRTGELAEALKIDGAIVAIDGWGNHHLDFVNVIEQLGKRGIPSVGVSYLGQQGRLVATNNYVDTIVDINKEASGYETCMVGQNNVTDLDAQKAVGLLKLKLKREGKLPVELADEPIDRHRLTKKNFRITSVAFGDKTTIERGRLTLRKGIETRIVETESRIRGIDVRFLKPGDVDWFVNSNLDFSPIAVKNRGPLGRGITHCLTGITVMSTGVEAKTGFQPSNIGSSEGLLKERVAFNQAGTPSSDDFILHIDYLFEPGEGRTAEGLEAAHRSTDRIVDEIRRELKDLQSMRSEKEEFYDRERPGKPRVILVKITSGLGNMYDSSIFPKEPAGYIESRLLRDCNNIPFFITPNQCRDGVLHTLL